MSEPERQAHTLAAVPIGPQSCIRVNFIRMEGPPERYLVELQALEGPQRLMVPVAALPDLVWALEAAQSVHDVAKHDPTYGGLHSPRMADMFRTVAADVEAKRERRANPKPRPAPRALMRAQPMERVLSAEDVREDADPDDCQDMGGDDWMQPAARRVGVRDTRH